MRVKMNHGCFVSIYFHIMVMLCFLLRSMTHSYICVYIIYVLVSLCGIVFQGSVVVGCGDGEGACVEYILWWR